MLVILIDTCTERGVVALYRGLEPLIIEQLPFGLQNSKVLLPTIEAVLLRAHVETSQLDAVAVGVGPGSYTGIRVGVAAAKAIAFAHQLPLMAVSTLEGLIPPSDGSYAAVIDAKVGGVYYLLGERSGGRIHYHTQPAISEIDDFLERSKGITTVVTPVAATLQNRIDVSATQWQWLEIAPDTTQLMRVALDNYAQGHVSRNGHLDILYLRKTQAEIEREW